MSDKKDRVRMDFIIKIESWDKESGILLINLVPDPRRYEWRELDGEPHLYDKLDNFYISEQVLLKSAKTLGGKPIYAQPQMIDDAEEYVKSRREPFSRMLEGHVTPPTYQDKSEEFLESLKVDQLAFVILCLDIKGSTKLATTMDQESYAKLISSVIYELSEVVPKFLGYVLKYTGDGLIAYFPEPVFITKNDLAIDCALTMRMLVYQTLNPVLEEHHLPPIDIRIGLDAGEAYVVTIGSPETKQHKDIIGAIVNLSAKIQALAEPGGVYLGDTVERNLHTMWRQICEPVDLGGTLDYKDLEGNVYKVHRVKLQ